mgnify:CR=1 FL=1
MLYFPGGLYRGVLPIRRPLSVYYYAFIYFLAVLIFFIVVVLISVLGFGGIALFAGLPIDEAVFKEGRRRALPAA